MNTLTGRLRTKKFINKWNHTTRIGTYENATCVSSGPFIHILTSVTFGGFNIF